MIIRITLAILAGVVIAQCAMIHRLNLAVMNATTTINSLTVYQPSLPSAANWEKPHRDI